MNDQDQVVKDMMFLGKFTHEVENAREKFPSNKHQLAALGEEVGELQQAMIEHDVENASAQEVWEEAVQVAAMALRVATEGDDSFDYDPEDGIQ